MIVAAEVIREGSLVTSDGEDGVWRVSSISVAIGGHHQVAWIERPEAMEKWNRGGHVVPMRSLRIASV